MNTCPNKMIDLEIVEDMSSTEESRHYQRYLTDRFVVTHVHEVEDGLCAHVFDNELGEEVKVHSGDQLADGTVEVIEEGVVFRPPRADVESFLLPSSLEMMPIGNHRATKARNKMNDVLEREHMMMPYDDDDDKMIIVLSGEY